MMETRMNIRRFKESDLKSLIELWQTIFPDSPPHNEPSSIINEKLAVDDLIFVVEHGGQLIGACMAGYDGHRGWLYYLAVDPDFQGHGYGRQIVQAAEEVLKAAGCPTINLQVRKSNTQVIDFYKALGFGEDEVLSMGKRLSK